MTTPTSSTDAAPNIVARRTIHKGRKFDFEILTVRQRGRETQRENVHHPGAVVVVPVLDDGRIVLIRNHRVSVGERLWECCAGTMEPPEPPETCAARELVEETGYRAATIVPLGWFYTTPGLTDERMHAFIARGLSHVGQDLEDDESIEVVALPVAQVLTMIDSGELRDAKSMAAILLAERAGLLSPVGVTRSNR
ncbi:MAG: NUDIX hydrolase [Phycisphaeraceae bacterium]|nr:NUDIX hydrolase [Phycisphaeraceae bacterium]